MIIMQKDIKKSISDFPTFEENPFKPLGLEVKNIRDIPNSEIMVSETTGEYLSVTPLGKIELKTFDNVKYCKLYDEAVPVIQTFSIPAIKVWGYIISILKPTRDYIYFDMKECLKDTKYTASLNVYKGLTELVEKEFIARSTGKGNTYYINPNMFFNGDRRKI